LRFGRTLKTRDGHDTVDPVEGARLSPATDRRESADYSKKTTSPFKTPGPVVSIRSYLPVSPMLLTAAMEDLVTFILTFGAISTVATFSATPTTDP